MGADGVVGFFTIILHNDITVPRPQFIEEPEIISLMEKLCQIRRNLISQSELPYDIS